MDKWHIHGMGEWHYRAHGRTDNCIWVKQNVYKWHATQENIVMRNQQLRC